MIMMDKMPDPDEDSGLLLKVLTAHFNALVSARSDEAVLKQYSALLRFIRSRPADFLEDEGYRKRRADPVLKSGLNEENLQRVSLTDLEKLVNDEVTSRRDLERIAIERFSVPRGSMRSFSNKQALIDKLRSLIDNERAHETIGAVARGELEPTREE
jgi:hypothetical protein